MKQNEMNSQKAQELTKEELEQVNGGKVTIQEVVLMLLYFYARKDWETYTKRNLWLIFA